MAVLYLLFALFLAIAPIIGLICCANLIAIRKGRRVALKLCLACEHPRDGMLEDDPCRECGRPTHVAVLAMRRRQLLPALLWIPGGIAMLVTALYLPPPCDGIAATVMSIAFLAGPLTIALMLGMPRFGIDALTPWVTSLVTGTASTLMSAAWLLSLTTRTTWGQYGPAVDILLEGIVLMFLSMGAAGYLGAFVIGAFVLIDRRYYAERSGRR
jgi:hypothetical protein